MIDRDYTLKLLFKNKVLIVSIDDDEQYQISAYYDSRIQVEISKQLTFYEKDPELFTQYTPVENAISIFIQELVLRGIIEPSKEMVNSAFDCIYRFYKNSDNIWKKQKNWRRI